MVCSKLVRKVQFGHLISKNYTFLVPLIFSNSILVQNLNFNIQSMVYGRRERALLDFSVEKESHFINFKHQNN
jgi:hypothetical protein